MSYVVMVMSPSLRLSPQVSSPEGLKPGPISSETGAQEVRTVRGQQRQLRGG